MTFTEWLTANGIGYAETVIAECAAQGVPLEVVLVVLDKETGGGRNIYGHDLGACSSVPGQTIEVTPSNWASYMLCVFDRDPSGHVGRNGAGPMQLTHWSLQDEADAEGGCWDPAVNIRVGVRTLRRHLVNAAGDLWEVFRRYSGKTAYADDAMARLPRWREIARGPAMGSPDAFMMALRKYGVAYREYPGWRTRNTGRAFTALAVTVHDSVTGFMTDPRAAEFCVAGRIDVPGPLYTALLGQDGLLWLLAWGATNNSGATNAARCMLAKTGMMPLDRELGAPPADDYALTNQQHHGIAYITYGAGPYTAAQIATMPRVLAALTETENWSAEGGARSLIDHGEATRRKVDSRRDAGTLRRDVLQLRRTGPTPVPPPIPPEDDMSMSFIHEALPPTGAEFASALFQIPTVGGSVTTARAWVSIGAAWNTADVPFELRKVWYPGSGVVDEPGVVGGLPVRPNPTYNRAIPIGAYQVGVEYRLGGGDLNGRTCASVLVECVSTPA